MVDGAVCVKFRGNVCRLILPANTIPNLCADPHVQEGSSAADIQAALAARGVNTWVSSASSTLLDFQRRGLHQVNCWTLSLAQA